MMKLFRKDAMKRWGMFIASFVILVFMLWGGQTYLLGEKQKYNYAGKVFGRKVSFEEFHKSLRQVEALARMQYGENFQKFKDALNLDAEAWDRIILLAEARKRRIAISDTAVVEAIENITHTPIDTPLARQNYESFLRRQLGILPRNFEEAIRDSLKIARLSEQETGLVTVSDQDIEDAFRKKNEKVQVSYALFGIDDLKKDIPFDEAKAREYFEAHKDAFLIPPTVDVAFVQIDVPKIAAPAGAEQGPVFNEEIIRQNEDASDAAWQKAEDLYEQIIDGKKLAEVAKDNNLVLQTTGAFTMEQPVLKAGWTFPLIKKIFQAKTGEVLEPVGIDEGFQILAIKEKKDAYLPDYDQVKDKVREAWLTLEAKNLSQKKALETRKTLLEEFAKFKNPDFAAIAKGLNLTLAQTPAFGRGEYLPTIGISKDFQETAFQLTAQNPLSEVVETQKGFALLHLDTTIAANMKEFDKEKDQFKAGLLQEKRAMAFNTFLNRLRIEANLEDNIAKIKAQQQKKE